MVRIFSVWPFRRSDVAVLVAGYICRTRSSLRHTRRPLVPLVLLTFVVLVEKAHTVLLVVIETIIVRRRQAVHRETIGHSLLASGEVHQGIEC